MVGKLNYKSILKLLLSLTIITLLCFSFFVFLSSANNQYEVGVFYFTNWNPELNPTAIKNYEKIYGRSNDHWGGVKDHLTQAGPWGDGPIPYREPLTGWYDDRQQSVVDQQILQASSRGIDHFAFYYYWKDEGGGERPGQQALYNFTNSPHKDLLKFYLYFVADGQWAASDWDSLIVPKLVNFMKDSSYKRTPDGRPIVGFYGDMLTRLGGAANLKTALEHLRTAAQEAGLQNPLLVVNGFRTLKTYVNDYGYDGFLPLNLAGIGLDSHPYVPEDYATSYPQAWNNFVYASYSPESGYENYENYLFIPGGLSAFDPRPWGKGKDKYVYADPSPSKFRDQLTNIKNYLDTHPSSMNISTIYAWNENGEGGTIEPTTIDGFGYLNAIQETFSLSNSAYKQKVQQLQLSNLDPGLRLELSPENAFGADGQIIKLKGKVSNRNAEPITSLQLTLNTDGWNIVSSSGTTIDNLAPGACQDVEFQVEIGDGELWTKHMLHVSAAGNMGQQNLMQTVSTFIVKTPDVYGVIEPVLQSVLCGDVVDLQVNVRNYSQIEQSGSFSVVAPAGWFISENGSGNFSLSGNTGSIQYNRKLSKVFNLCVPRDTPNGQYEVKLLLTSGGVTTEYKTYVTVGNYMTNGSFEGDSNNDGLADSWSKTNTSTTVSVSNDSVEGTKSQKISYTGYGAGIKQEWFNVQPNKEYIVEAWVKVESGEIRIEEDEADAKYVFLGVNAYKDVTGNTWQKVVVRYTPKTNASKMSIRFLTWSALPTVAYIDNVQFYSVSSVPVTGITLDKELVDMNLGEIQTTTAEIIPSNAVNKKVVFSSSNSEIVEITGTYYDQITGKTTVTFKAVGTGSAQLTATSLEGVKTAVCDINVYPVIQMVTILPIKELLRTGENQQLELNVILSDGSQAEISQSEVAYSTDNQLAALVDPNGLITAVGDGNANIKASVTLRGVTKEAETRVSVDGIPPVTTVNLIGTLRDDHTYNSHVLLTLIANDASGSGVDKILYSIVGSEWLDYQGPIEFNKNGLYRISFKSIDNLGNEEISKMLELTVKMNADIMIGYLLGNLDALEIHQGIKNSLASKLDNVLASLKKDNKKSAANQLTCFINEVEAKNSKELTAQQAVLLKLEAESIIEVINK